MTVHDKPVTDVPHREDERLWRTARAAFLERYSRTPNLTPEEVARWAVEAAVALCKEFRLQSTPLDSFEKPSETLKGKRS